MDWSKGYSASYYMTRVDPRTWRDIEVIGITGGSISRSTDSLMQSADVDCIGYGYAREEYVRIYLDTAQGGQHAHVPLFTGLATSPNRDIEGNLTRETLECYSVLKPCDDIVLPRGYFAPEGMPGAGIVAQLLKHTPAPVTVADGSPELSGSIIAEDGETALTMIIKVLQAINWRLRISGDGSISIEPQASEPVAMYDPNMADVIETKVTVSEDWYDCPNVVMCIDDDLTATARDDSTTSALSTVNRGREVWKVETNCDLGTHESLAGHTARRLRELQKVMKTAEYDRRFIPDVYPGDMVLIHYPGQGIEDIFTVDSQSIELGHAARTSEKVMTYISADAFIEREPQIGLVRLITDDRKYIVDDSGDNFVAFTEY